MSGFSVITAEKLSDLVMSLRFGLKILKYKSAFVSRMTVQ